MLRKTVKRAGQILLDICYPPKCILCQKRLEGEETSLCSSCAGGMPWTGKDGCQLGVQFDSCLSPLYYTEAFKPSFHRYKFRSHWHYSWTYGKWMWEYLQQYDPNYSRFDCVTWVPLHIWRRQRRGYDQARRLALAVSQASRLPLVKTLVKVKNIAPQSGTAKADQRWEHVRDVYAPKKGVELTGKRILLVDDVITTGATLESASGVLRKGGALEVCCLTLARGRIPRKEESEPIPQ